MDWLQIVLRVVHIFAGVAWVGGAALFFFYIQPAITKLGPDAEKFVAEVINRRRLPIYFAVASSLNVLFGLLLYWRVSGGLQPAWITSPTGLTFTLAALAALVAWGAGNVLIPRTLERLMDLGARMKSAGGPPAPELVAEMGSLQDRLRRLGLSVLVLLAIALLGMAAGRYVR